MWKTSGLRGALSAEASCLGLGSLVKLKSQLRYYLTLRVQKLARLRSKGQQAQRLEAQNTTVPSLLRILLDKKECQWKKKGLRVCPPAFALKVL